MSKESEECNMTQDGIYAYCKTHDCSQDDGEHCNQPNCPHCGSCKNTDKEIWRETEDDYYADSIHVTEHGGIGMNVGGSVIVKGVRDWHKTIKNVEEKDGEKKVLEHLVHAWNAFVELPTQHPDDNEEFRHALHSIQNLIGVRRIRRIDDNWYNEER